MRSDAHATAGSYLMKGRSSTGRGARRQRGAQFALLPYVEATGTFARERQGHKDITVLRPSASPEPPVSSASSSFDCWEVDFLKPLGPFVTRASYYWAIYGVVCCSW